MMQDSGHFNRSKLEKSLDMLNSSIAINKSSLQPLNLLQLTDDDRLKMERAGIEPAPIAQIDSESDMYDEDEHPQPPSDAPLKLETHHDDSEHYKLNEYLPLDLANLLIEREIPLSYVRGLLMVKDQKEIKSIRRLKVERYLEKRRNKTWNKKICYNCRQRVAEERLRIKGKFIKKRRAMQILGLATPISTVEVKRMLEELLQDKTLKEIEDIIKKEEPYD